MPLVRVTVPLPIETEFTYHLPDDLSRENMVGSRVEVPFGARKVLGIIVGEAGPADVVDNVKTIHRVLDEDEPSMTSELLELTRWVGEYYMCSWGEALKAALPPGLNRLSSKPPTRRKEAWLSFPEAFRDPDALLEIRKELRGKKQLAVVDALEAVTADRKTLSVRRAEIMDLSGAGHASVKALVDKGVVDLESRDYLIGQVIESRKPVLLSDEQQQALDQIGSSIDARTFETFLLHGVTGSGKTEVYIRALTHVLSLGRQGIVLVPEIALTPQTVGRFKAHFGEKVAVMHSRMSHGERLAEWRDLRTGRASIAIGPRSAVFAPLQNVGLIIVDEEHESSYKQHDPAPRYHARDVAVMRAFRNDAVCVLGSATPGLESYANSLAKKYTHLRMDKRVPLPDGSRARLPSVALIDLTLENKKKRLLGNFSQQLISGIENRVEKGEQVILLQNRRGFAPVVECTSCGWSPYCPSCSVTLTFHKVTRSLRCHYCGFACVMPSRCDQCSSNKLERLGSGTQRIEDDLHRYLPGVSVLRMDMDTTSGRTGHHDILDRFRQGEADVLLGTQMVAKGLDFGKVTLVGVVNADVGLLLPDFRAEERTFQLLMQVSGRAGRAESAGEVLIQTRNPAHPLFTYLVRHDYDGFSRYVLSIRKQLRYPPYTRMLAVAFRGSRENIVSELADRWVDHFRTIAPDEEVLGPLPSFIGRMKKQFRFHVYLKIPSGRFREVSEYVRQTQAAVRPKGRDYHSFVDVDTVGVY